MVRADHPSNRKHRGVCVYHENMFPLKILEIQCLNECINLGIQIGWNVILCF